MQKDWHITATVENKGMEFTASLKMSIKLGKTEKEDGDTLFSAPC